MSAWGAADVGGGCDVEGVDVVEDVGAVEGVGNDGGRGSKDGLDKDGDVLARSGDEEARFRELPRTGSKTDLLRSCWAAEDADGD